MSTKDGKNTKASTFIVSNALEDFPHQRLDELFQQIHARGDSALSALSRALGDPDVHLLSDPDAQVRRQTQAAISKIQNP